MTTVSRVTLGFGGLDSGVSPGGVNEVTVIITDNDDPDVEVRFDADAYDVAEGGRRHGHRQAGQGP